MDAFKLLQQWTNEDSKKSKGGIDPNNLKLYKADMVKGEYILNKADANKFLNSANEVTEILNKHWTDCNAKIESENPILVKKEFNINSIPLQLLSKVNSELTNKEIEYILATVRSIETEGFYVTSKEGIELSRIEALLEDRITENLNDEEYKSLEGSVRLLQRIKDSYRKVKLSNCGRSLV